MTVCLRDIDKETIKGKSRGFADRAMARQMQTCFLRPNFNRSHEA